MDETILHCPALYLKLSTYIFIFKMSEDKKIHRLFTLCTTMYGCIKSKKIPLLKDPNNVMKYVDYLLNRSDSNFMLYSYLAIHRASIKKQN